MPETGANWGDRVLQLAGVLSVPTSDFYTFTSYHVPGQSSVVLVGGLVVQAPEDPEWQDFGLVKDKVSVWLTEGEYDISMLVRSAYV